MNAISNPPPAPLIMAPLRGVTVLTYRKVFAKHFSGVDCAVAPFITAANAERVRLWTLDDVNPANGQAIPIVPQVTGHNVPDLLVICQALADLGYREINWNLGCPWKFVVNKGRGAGLLARPDVVRGILDELCRRDEFRLSIKARLGLDDPGQLMAMAPMLNQYPLSRIIIHPRIARQQYEGKVDLEMFGRCLEALSAPVVYNGDIWMSEHQRAMSRRFASVQGWMMGRGLIADPFLAADIRGDSSGATDRVGVVGRFLEELLEAYCDGHTHPERVLGIMKELWDYLAPSFHDFVHAYSSIIRSGSIDEYRSVVRAFLETAEWRGGSADSRCLRGVIPDSERVPGQARP